MSTSRYPTPANERYYLLRVRIDGTTVKKMLRDSFAKDERLEDYIAVLLHYLYATQKVDRMTEDLFRMWKKKDAKVDWPPVLLQEFTKIYPAKNRSAETLPKLLERKKNMTAAELKAVVRRKK